MAASTTISTPHSGQRTVSLRVTDTETVYLTSSIDIASRVLRHRGLLAALTLRELKARYRGSILGFFWSLVQPLLLLAVYTFVFSVVFQPRSAGADPYALFLVCGLFPWIWLSTALVEGTTSLVASAGLIRRAVFPAELDYNLSGAIIPIVTARDYLEAQARTLGDFQGEGECPTRDPL